MVAASLKVKYVDVMVMVAAWVIVWCVSKSYLSNDFISCILNEVRGVLVVRHVSPNLMLKKYVYYWHEINLVAFQDIVLSYYDCFLILIIEYS